ncbi:GNAT family N-acetyltransferase [Phenylobacterium sp.]|uniref:GNAT family N-acetyltransferase n=1 Tax=Phenylobacterium sp. TaxID=1871053 RepID=UPI0025F43AF7|nr:GNAT family N-acetyltransferase [Phenylobacterium sp.]MBX3485193.1 GNAT family N-acetyltransferase [Phenylobacterium sp.]MCW5759417.1 GNAT family N-acetyltransferase [Phenylobacterium sp.]
MCAVDVRPAIATERLVLRGLVAGDAPQVAELASDFNVAAMTARIPHPYALSDAEWFVGYAQARDPRREANFAIEHRRFGVIGVLGFDGTDPRRPEVGYWLGRPFWGRGYASEALKAAMAWARADWGKNAVWAGHFADNRASGGVLVKAGFLYTGDVETRHSVARGEDVPTRMMVWLA